MDTWLEEQLTEHLVAYSDRARFDGAVLPGPKSAAELPAEARQQLSRMKACLDLLQAIQAEDSLAQHPVDGTESAATIRPDSPRQIGRFQIRRELGVGGFGIVYLAWDPKTEREIALKVPHFQAIASGDLQRRFAQEAKAAARLDHPHIVPVLEAATDGVLPYIASVYYPGLTLAHWLAAQTEAIAPRAAAEFLIHLADALQHAHQRNVLHRDIKPSNVLLVAENGPTSSVSLAKLSLAELTPKLMDFGLAKMIGDAPDMTRTGALLGTIRYMSPEQARGQIGKVGAAADIYSLGVVLYELLVGRTPFDAASDAGVLKQIQEEEPLRPRQARRSIPLDLQTICLRCLEKQAGRRYSSAGELANDLRRFLKGEPIKARRVSAPEAVWKWCQRRPALAMLVALATASACGLVGGLLVHDQRVTELLKVAELERDGAREAESQARHSAYAADMHLAFEAWRSATGAQTRKILDRYAPHAGEVDRRDFVWWYLQNLTHEPILLARHEESVTAVAVSPDGSVLVTASAGAVQLWNSATRQKIGDLVGQPGHINAIAFSPDGRVLVAAGDDALRRWEIPDGKQLDSLSGTTGWTADVEFSPDGRFIAAAGGDRLVRVWHSATGELAGVLAGHEDAVRTIAFGPRGELITASEDGVVRAWNTKTMQADTRLADGTLENPTDDHIFALSLEASKNFLLGSCRSGALMRWEMSDEDFGKATGPLGFHGQTRCLVSDADDTLAVGVSTGKLLITRAASGAADNFRARYGHNDRINSVAYIAGRNEFLTGSRDGTARIFPGLKYAEAKFMSSGREANSLSWSGNRILSCVRRDSTVYVINAETGDLLDKIRIELPTWAGIAASQELVIVLNVDRQELHAIRLESKDEAWKVQLDDACSNVALDPADRTVALSIDGRVLIFDLVTGSLRHTLHQGAAVCNLVFIPGTGLLLAGLTNGHCIIWDSLDGEQLCEETVHRGPVDHIAAAANGDCIATIGDRTVRVWDYHDWRLVSEWFLETADVKRVAFLDQGETLLVHAETGIRIYRVADGAQLLDLRGAHPAQVVAVSPDGRRVATQVDHVIDFVDGTRRDLPVDWPGEFTH